MLTKFDVDASISGDQVKELVGGALVALALCDFVGRVDWGM